LAIPQRVLVDLSEAMASENPALVANDPGHQQSDAGQGLRWSGIRWIDHTHGDRARPSMNNERENLVAGILVATKYHPAREFRVGGADRGGAAQPDGK